MSGVDHVVVASSRQRANTIGGWKPPLPHSPLDPCCTHYLPVFRGLQEFAARPNAITAGFCLQIADKRSPPTRSPDRFELFSRPQKPRLAILPIMPTRTLVAAVSSLAASPIAAFS